ncbi:unnamed protein product [Paramecium sonneborni]|uniref:Protein kinase domain-containing protein n=1 Tax=Paramecium sonneborni TaxID=65129 RepID=A0A8S1KPV9_9CILI|nr:unnamed protein product [Paramecium sonneborni]
MKGDLDKYLRQNFNIKEPKAIRILQAIVNAVNEINQKGFIHRDIKPANILLSGNQPKLADFGFAVPIWQARIQQKSINVGTPLYMSPQALGQQNYSEKGDVWAVGILYFEMLFGKTPFNAKSESALLTNILSQQLIIPLTPSISELSKDFIKKCLQIDDSKRINVKAMFEHRIIQSNHFCIFLEQHPLSEIKTITLPSNRSNFQNNKRSQTQNSKRHTKIYSSALQKYLYECNEQNFNQQKIIQRSSSQNEIFLTHNQQNKSKNSYPENIKQIKMLSEYQLNSEFLPNNQILLFYINYCRYLYKFSQYLDNSKFFSIETRNKIIFILSKCIVIKICQISKILDKENNNYPQLQQISKKCKQNESFISICSVISEYQIKYLKHFYKNLRQAIKNNFQQDPIIGSSCNESLIENYTIYDIALHYLNIGLNQLKLNFIQITVERLSYKTENAEFQQLLFIDEGLKNCKELIIMNQNCQYNYQKSQQNIQNDKIKEQKLGLINCKKQENQIYNYF